VFGDRIDASNNVRVRIASLDSNILIGKFQRSLSWSAPKEVHDPSPVFLSRAQKVLAELFNRNKDNSYYGAARGDLASCNDLVHGTKQSLEPLVALPAIPQVIGSDLTEIVVAWKPVLNLGNVSVILSQLDGNVISKKHICNRNHCQIDIPQDSIHAGENFILEVLDTNGKKLKWDISVVLADTLPKPQESTNDNWLLGVWRLIETGDEYKLDSVSRLSTGIRKSYASWMFQKAIFENNIL
jgi:hypothetical protein